MEGPSSGFRELTRVKLEKEPLSEEEHHHPVAPKSTDGPDPDPDPKGYRSNHKLQQPAPTPCSSTGKRPNEEAGVDGSNKKSKTKTPPTPSKLWSEEDEITLLNGMIDFRSRNAPNADFHKFIKGKLKGAFSREQLKSKKGNLRDRFVKNCETGVFSNPDEEIIFHLSKKIWGNNSDAHKKKETEIKANQKEVAKGKNDGEKTEFWTKYPALNESFHKMGNSPSFSMSQSGFRFVKERLSLIGSGKVKKLDMRWRELIVKEMDFKSKEMEIKSKHLEIKSKQMEIKDEMFALMTEQFKMAFDH